MVDVASRADVARVLGRAAFGATGADLNTWTGRPYADLVDSLFPPGPVGSTSRLPFADEAERIELERSANNDLATAQRWWLERMRTTPYPLEERLTLFWHDHFATAYSGQPDVGQVMIQNQLLRVHSLGSFRAMANAITTDAATLVWLNGTANHTNGVNENYAREFFELFTLGVLPQVYTETDIREAAKAFTGFVVNTTTRASSFTPARHRLGTKSVLGRTVGGYPANDARNATEYQEITEAALAHDDGWTAARFLAYKLVIQFGYQPDESNLGADELIRDVAAALRPGWDLRAGVRTMLMHEHWRFAPASAGKQLVRSPIELVVHAAKVLGVVIDLPSGTLSAQQALASAQRAGQAPFNPPNVGGWPTGLGWLSQTTTLGRYDMFNNLVTAFRGQQRDKAAPMPASGDFDWWAWYLGLAGFTTNTRLRLQEYLAAPGTTVEADKQASMFILVGSSPDWQVM